MPKKEKNSKNRIIVIAIAIVIVGIIIFAVVNKNIIKKEEGKSGVIATQQQNESNDKLGNIQSKIDAQQKVIDDIKNNELTPLIEEKTKLEEQLMKLTSTEGENTGNIQE